MSRNRPGDVKARSLNGEEVWRRVREYARHAMESRTKIPTLVRGVANVITNVKDRSIWRWSAAGRTNRNPVIKAHVVRV